MGKRKKKKKWKNRNKTILYYEVPDVTVSSEQVKDIAISIFGGLYYETKVQVHDE